MLEYTQQKLVEVSNLRNTRQPKVIWKASRNYSRKDSTVGNGGMQEHVGETCLHMV